MQRNKKQEYSREIMQKMREDIREKASKKAPAGDFYFKMLRRDLFKSNTYFPNFSFSFIMELIDPIKNSLPKRIGDKRDFTVTGDGVFARKEQNANRAPLKKPQYTKKEKVGFTNFQSATLAMPGYLPPVCEFFGEGQVQAGVIIDSKDSLASTRLFLEDGDTIKRPYDFNNYDEALSYYNKNKKSLYSNNKFSQYKNELANKKTINHNEPLVRLRWNNDSSSKVAIMKDNLESRLQAKQYAINIENAFYQSGVKDPNYTVPIVYYTPDNDALLFKEYTNEEYELDCAEAQEIYLDSAKRQKKYDAGRYEFLLGLDIKQQEFALLDMVTLLDGTEIGMANLLLTSSNMFILRVLKNNTKLTFDDIFTPSINNMDSDKRLQLFDHALRSSYDELIHHLNDAYVDFLLYPIAAKRYDWFLKLLELNNKEIFTLENEQGDSIFHHLANEPDTRYIEAILKKFPDSIHIAMNRENEFGNTAFSIASNCGNQALSDLLKNYATLNNQHIEEATVTEKTSNAVNASNKISSSAALSEPHKKLAEIIQINVDTLKLKQGKAKTLIYDKGSDDALIQISISNYTGMPILITKDFYIELNDDNHFVVLDKHENIIDDRDVINKMLDQTLADLLDEHNTLAKGASILRETQTKTITNKSPSQPLPSVSSTSTNIKSSPSDNTANNDQYLTAMTLLVNDQQFLQGKGIHIKTGRFGNLFQPDLRPSILEKIHRILMNNNPITANEKQLVVNEIQKLITRHLTKMEDGKKTHNSHPDTCEFMKAAIDLDFFNKKYVANSSKKIKNDNS